MARSFRRSVAASATGSVAGPDFGRRRRGRGLSAAATGAVLWGVSGVVAQEIFARGGSPAWLTAVRLLAAGGILFAVLRPTLPPRSETRPLALAALGLAGAQYSYFAAIAHSNVATASFIQYLAVPLIVLYERGTGRTPLRWQKVAALVTVLVGTALLVATPGGGLAISATGLAFAITCAVLIAVYTIASAGVVAALGAWQATAWASLLGALPLVFWAPIWRITAHGSGAEFGALVVFVAVIGTLVATGLYLASLRSISAGETGTVSTMEAVAAALFAFLLLDVSLSASEYIGGGLVLGAVALLYLLPPGPSQPAAVLPPPVPTAGEARDSESDRADQRGAVASAGARRRACRVPVVLAGGRALEGEPA